MTCDCWDILIYFNETSIKYPPLLVFLFVPIFPITSISLTPYKSPLSPHTNHPSHPIQITPVNTRQVLKQAPRFAANPLNPHTKKLQPVNNNSNNNNNRATGGTTLHSNASQWNAQTTSAGTFQDAPFFVPQFNDDGIDDDDDDDDDNDDAPKGAMSMSMPAGKGSMKNKRALTPFDDEG